MHRKSLVLLFTLIGSLLAGCAHRQSSYAGWDEQLQTLPSRMGTVGDVSVTIGAPPKHCDPLPSQGLKIGVHFDTKTPVPVVVTWVAPNGAAARGSIRVGDTIREMGGRPVHSAQEAMAVLRNADQDGKPLQIVTSRGTVAVVPEAPNLERCYWDIEAGKVTQGGGATYLNPFGGAPNSLQGPSDRFFRTSCRVSDGYVLECRSDWSG